MSIRWLPAADGDVLRGPEDTSLPVSVEIQPPITPFGIGVRSENHDVDYQPLG